MSKYTTELRFICENYAGRTESAGLSDVKTIVELACPKIFDDDIPFFDEAYRLPLEKKIIMHYYTREISGEVVGIWKLWLNNRMREIMPYYNQLYKSALIEFDPLLTKKFTEEYSGEASKDTSGNIDFTGNKTDSQITSENNTKTSAGSTSNTSRTDENGTTNESGSTVSNSSNSDNATERRLYSDTPQGGLNNVEDETYLTNYTKNLGLANATATSNITTSNDGETSNSSTTTNGGSTSLTDNGTKNQSVNVTDNVLQNTASDENTNTTESFLRSITGYDGGSASKLLQEFRDTFINIDVRIIDELGDLFFNLW